MTKQSKRAESLMPNGIPRWIRVYDNEGETADRYSVTFTGRYPKTAGFFQVVDMSALPLLPQGVCLHGEYTNPDALKPGQWPPAIGRKGPLGRRIRFEDLPAACQRVVLKDYREIWGLEE